MDAIAPDRLAGPDRLASAHGLRIALFTGNYNYLREGANNALNRLVGHVLDRGGKVRIYSPTSRTPAFAPVGDLVSVPSIALPVRSEFRVALGIPRATRRDVETFVPNIVHVATPDLLGTAALRFARRRGIPAIASLHTLFETYLNYYGLGALRRWAWNRQQNYYRQAALVLAPSPAMVEHLKAMGVSENRIRIWGRGIDRRVFTPALRSDAWRAAAGYGRDEVVVCFFGRVVREKGINLFAETIAELQRRGHAVRPLIIGDGPASAEFREKLGPSVFTGHLSGEALGRALASADILLNPSTTETFGNVNTESLAAGLAVVAADVDSARSIIEPGRTGLLCDASPAAFADAVESLLTSRGRRLALGRSGSAWASSLDWSAINDAAVRAYRELLP